MNKFIVLDDVFDEATNRALVEFGYGVGEIWYDLGVSPLHEKILQLCQAHFDLGQMVGYEMWCNAKNPGWHVDKDERTFQEHKRLVFPLCSAVYYAAIDNVIGGEFFTEDLRLLPRANRLLIFSPGISHGVSAFRGIRTAISINPWNHRIRPRV